MNSLEATGTGRACATTHPIKKSVSTDATVIARKRRIAFRDSDRLLNRILRHKGFLAATGLVRARSMHEKSCVVKQIAERLGTAFAVVVG